MSIEIKIPDIGEDKLPIIEILVAAGDNVKKEDPLMVLESDKAALEVPAPNDGTIESISVVLNDEVGTGSVVGVMSVSANEVTENATSEAAEKTTSASVEIEKPDLVTAPSPVKTVAPAVNTSIDEVSFANAHASPSVRKFARELGADLGQITGTGRKNRITQEDVSGYIKSILSGTATLSKAGGSAIPSIPATDFSKFGSVEAHKLSRINVLTGEHMTRCWLNIPHVTQNDEADVTDLEVFRKSLRDEAEKAGVRVSMLSFLMKAVVSAMQAYPTFNSSLSEDGQSLLMKQYFNIGIAVDTPAGLVVPVIRDVDKKGIFELSSDLMEMSEKARNGKLKPADMQGGCMTISSLGGIGGTNFTPIVNAPEVAILGVSRSKIQAVWDGQGFVPRNILPMSLSYDHRVIDGAVGARFTQHLSQTLSDAKRLLL